MPLKKELIGVSKFLSMVLRHKPDMIGITLDANGWTDVKELIDRSNTFQKSEGFTPMTKAILDEVVADNDKKRYEYSEDGWQIRACQGHSVDVDLDLDAKTPPKYLLHGTAKQFIQSIKSNGLNKRKRNHVHLSKDHDTAVKVGSRHGTPHVLRIDTEAMRKDGIDFFLSNNDVWLVDEVPSKYIDFNYNDLIPKMDVKTFKPLKKIVK